MTIKKIYEKLDNFTVDERAEWLKRLFNLFSPLSMEQLRQFEEEFNVRRLSSDNKLQFKDFIKEQNAEIKLCIDLEVAERVGTPIRKVLNLPKITMETKV